MTQKVNILRLWYGNDISAAKLWNHFWCCKKDSSVAAYKVIVLSFLNLNIEKRFRVTTISFAKLGYWQLYEKSNTSVALLEKLELW